MSKAMYSKEKTEDGWLFNVFPKYNFFIHFIAKIIPVTFIYIISIFCLAIFFDYFVPYTIMYPVLDLFGVFFSTIVHYVFFGWASDFVFGEIYVTSDYSQSIGFKYVFFTMILLLLVDWRFFRFKYIKKIRLNRAYYSYRVGVDQIDTYSAKGVGFVKSENGTMTYNCIKGVALTVMFEIPKTKIRRIFVENVYDEIIKSNTDKMHTLNNNSATGYQTIVVYDSASLGRNITAASAVTATAALDASRQVGYGIGKILGDYVGRRVYAVGYALYVEADDGAKLMLARGLDIKTAESLLKDTDHALNGTLA